MDVAEVGRFLQRRRGVRFREHANDQAQFIAKVIPAPFLS